MNDYLEIFEKFNDVKEIKDQIDDVKKLRGYYRSWQFQEMQNHINSLTQKYALETFIWNTVNKDAPTTYEQAYINAENFMCVQGAKIIVENVHEFKNRLSAEEVAFIESWNLSME